MKNTVCKKIAPLLVLLSCSCVLKGGIKDTMYFCRNYKFVKLTIIEDGVEKDSEEYSSLVISDPNYTYIHFVKDGSFIQRTCGKYLESNNNNDYDLIERGTYYQDKLKNLLDSKCLFQSNHSHCYYLILNIFRMFFV